jgi:hypothetical protein
METTSMSQNYEHLYHGPWRRSISRPAIIALQKKPVESQQESYQRLLPVLDLEIAKVSKLRHTSSVSRY